MQFRSVGILVFAIALAGCGRVQRTLSVNSNPPGALLVMNDQEIGRTPVTRDFTWYGTYDVVLRKEGYKTLKTRAEVVAPIWQWAPIDFVFEFSPTRLKDRHEVLFQLEPETEGPSTDEMLGRAEQARVSLESSQFTRNPATRPVTRPTTQAGPVTSGPVTSEPSTNP